MLEFIALLMLVILTGIQQYQIEKLKANLMKSANLIGEVVKLNGVMVVRLNELTALITKKSRKTIVEESK